MEVADDIANTPAEGLLRERFARGEIDAEEYERSLAILGSGGSGAGHRGAKRSRFLIAGLATAALLTAGGVAYAHGDGQQEAAGAATNGNDTGSMMSGGDMGSMMGNGSGMGSMMAGQGGGQMMGSFDEDKPFDLQFIDQMTMHHEGAIMSSEHMISDSERPELRQLAESIQKSQSEQIKQMQGFRNEWYADSEQTSGMPAGMMDQMMGDGSGMREMMGGSMQEMMGGEATDEMFLRMMIPHHQMGVDMGEKALEEAEHPETKKLAQKIIDEQSAEIELMQGYLDEIEAADES
jgi:uncharacterized protein (DUF305 family)